MTVRLATRLRSVARTHVGRVRQLNEDRLLDRPERGLWAVADGMGGHRGGDLAAGLAIAALADLADSAAPLTPETVAAAIVGANAAIHAESVRGAATIGTTIVVLLLADDHADIFWAGDSRAYLVRDRSARLLTTDHSLVQELIDAGAITPAAARSHPQANVVTRALGVAPEITLDHQALPVLPGDRLLLCSDGLSRTFDNDDAFAGKDDEAVANHLLAAALARDGSDNITFVLASTALL